MSLELGNNKVEPNDLTFMKSENNASPAFLKHFFFRLLRERVAHCSENITEYYHAFALRVTFQVHLVSF